MDVRDELLIRAAVDILAMEYRISVLEDQVMRLQGESVVQAVKTRRTAMNAQWAKRQSGFFKDARAQASVEVAKCGGDLKLAAQSLGVSYMTLWKWQRAA